MTLSSSDGLSPFPKYVIDVYDCPIKSDELTIKNYYYYTYARKIKTGQSRPGDYFGVEQKVCGLWGRKFILIMFLPLF